MFGIQTLRKLFAAKGLNAAVEATPWETLRLKGKKTYIGAALIGVSIFLFHVACAGCTELSDGLVKFGEAMGLAGLRAALSRQSYSPSGGKTYLGSLLIVAGAVLEYIGFGPLAEAIYRVGEAFGILGLRAAVNKAAAVRSTELTG